MKSNHIIRRIVCSVFAMLIFVSFLQITPVNALMEYITSIGNYEEYLQYLEEIDDDAHFMYYDYIKEIGEFQLFYASSSADMGSPHHYFHFYQYEILDENQYPLEIIIGNRSENIPKSRTVLFPLRDMQTANKYLDGRIQRGPLLYIYKHDKLSSIGLHIGDTVLYINVSSDSFSLRDYPMDGERTIVRRLLSRNYFVALAAYYELIWDIPLQPGETWLGRMQYILWPILGFILLIAACITAIWLIRHIRRKKRAMFPTQWHNRRCKNSAPDDTEN